MKIKDIHWIFLLALLFHACQTPIPNSGLQIQSETTNKHFKQNLAARIRHKKLYTGPIQIQINPNWFKNQSASTDILSTLDLTNSLEKTGFQTQAIPQGEMVFQKTFIKTKELAEFTEVILLTDTSSRYTLHLQKHSPQPDGKALVNINGFDWMTEADFKQGTQEIEKSSLLLNAKNSLKIKLLGKTSSSYTVSLVKGGDAKTILRRRGKLGSLKDSHADRIRHNDTNIFDPNDLISLGGLKPYQGDYTISAPYTTETIQLSGTRVNNSESLLFENGSLALKFTDATTGLQVFQDHYGAIVQNELDGFYKLKLDLNTSPVLNLTELIRKYNQHIETNIESIQFSSLAALQTWAIVFDAIERFPGLIKSIDFNLLGQAPTVTPIKFGDSGYIDQ